MADGVLEVPVRPGATTWFEIGLLFALAGACGCPDRVFRASHDGRSYEARVHCTYEGWDETKWCEVEVVERSGCTTRQVGRTRYDRLDSCCCEPAFETDDQGLRFAVREIVYEGYCDGSVIDAVRVP
jgi:hypothetical protein